MRFFIIWQGSQRILADFNFPFLILFHYIQCIDILLCEQSSIGIIQEII